jgi:hypothetical protein
VRSNSRGRDTVAVKAGYHIVMLTKLERYIGEYVIHCHILDHGDRGMMMNVNVVSEDSQDNGTISPALELTVSHTFNGWFDFPGAFSPSWDQLLKVVIESENPHE